VVRELEAEILKLKAEKNIIFLEIQNLKNNSNDALVVAKAETSDAIVAQRELEAKIAKLKAEKKILVGEVKAARKDHQGSSKDLKEPVRCSSIASSKEEDFSVGDGFDFHIELDRGHELVTQEVHSTEKEDQEHHV